MIFRVTTLEGCLSRDNNRPEVDTQKLNRAPGRPLREPDIAASCICRVQADAPADDQETKFGICPEAAYGGGESQPQRTPALARY